MKTLFLSLTIAVLAFTSCSKNEENEPAGQTTESYIDATSKTTWNYYSFSTGKLTGTCEETKAGNDEWFSRKDWDIAVNRYSIRTNGGEATTVSSLGGVYSFPASVTFASVGALPEGVQFTADKTVTSEGMGGETSIIKSAVTVVTFKANDDGSLVMPPVYLQAPVYIFRTADGNKYYKVQFTQYQDENKVAGHVKFSSAQIQ